MTRIGIRHGAVAPRLEGELPDERDQRECGEHDDHDAKCDETSPYFTRTVQAAVSPQIVISLPSSCGRALHLRHRVRLAHRDTSLSHSAARHSVRPGPW